jgi:hypothetical protein
MIYLKAVSCFDVPQQSSHRQCAASKNVLHPLQTPRICGFLPSPSALMARLLSSLLSLFESTLSMSAVAVLEQRRSQIADPQEQSEGHDKVGSLSRPAFGTGFGGSTRAHTRIVKS